MSHFSDLVHPCRSDLNLKKHLFIEFHGGVQRLIARCLGLGDPVAHPFRNRFIEVGDVCIDTPAAFNFIFGCAVDDDTSGQKVVNLLKRHVLGLHLGIDGRNRLDAPFDAVGKLALPAFDHRIQSVLNRCQETLRDMPMAFLGGLDLGFNVMIHLRVLEQHQLLLEFRLDLVQAQAVHDRDVNVFDLMEIFP